MRRYAVALIVGSVAAAVLNIAVPRDDDDGVHILRIAHSDSWPFLHAGLIVAVLLILGGLYGVVRLVRDTQPELAAISTGALLIGGGVMLSALTVAGTALRKASDRFAYLFDAPVDRNAAFLSAVGLDRLAYGLYGLAFVVLLGVFPVTLGVALYRSKTYAALGVAGVLVGASGLVAGLVQLTAEVDTAILALVASLAVTLWSLALGVLLYRTEFTPAALIASKTRE